MTIRTRILLAAVSLSLPLTALAAPSPVTGIKAERTGSQIHISWKKLPDSEKVAYYRIFFSTQSIIKNNGQYDDFDIAEGTAGEHTLGTAPATGTLFISVLAINDKSEESPVFAEEATVGGAVAAPAALSSAASSAQISSAAISSAAISSASPASAAPAVTSGTFSILSAEAITSTGVLVTFTAPVQINPADAALAFTITDASGAVLMVTRLAFSGSSVALSTLPQDGMKVYQLRTAQLQGVGSDGAALSLDPAQGVVLFAGFGGAASDIPPAQVPAEAPEISSLILRAEPDESGGFAADVAWEIAGAKSDIMSFLISQTTDNGRTFGAPQELPATSQHVRIPGIPGGAFGIKVQTVAINGEVSAGVTQFIDLTSSEEYQPFPPLGATVTPQEPMPEPDHLTQSGMTPFALIAVVGAALGFAIVRRRMTVPV